MDPNFKSNLKNRLPSPHSPCRLRLYLNVAFVIIGQIIRTFSGKAIYQCVLPMEKNMPHTAHVMYFFDAPIDKIWEIMQDFNGLSSYHPAIIHSMIEEGKANNEIGCIRRLTLESGFVREKLLTFDAPTFSFTYAIIDGTLPVTNYVAGVRLRVDEEACQTIGEWWADFEVVNTNPQALIDVIEQQVFKVGFQSVAENYANRLLSLC